MKRKCAILAILCVLFCSTTLPSFAHDGIEPMGFSTITFNKALQINVPAYTSTTFPATQHYNSWTLDYNIRFSVTYDLNTGQITKVSNLTYTLIDTTELLGKVAIMSIDNNNTPIAIASDGIRVTYTPKINVSLKYFATDGSGATENKLFALVGPLDTVYPMQP